MNNYIFIEGAALWVLIACVAAAITGFIVLGCAYINSLNKIEELNRENEDLAYENLKLRDKLYRDSFKPTEV